ncbi:MAG: Phosphate transport system regulatory protein PhoU [Clostridiales bacterium 38_11]|nr:MAG: Phosphate transport system regulatory protein PhoU [Clostridiales bacterium 38_11]HBH12456.1 phosphate transport system regulatory protein PhoU [Clostridiales bacterium]
MRQNYDEQLMYLNQDILNLGAMAEKILDMAIKALLEQDYELALEVIEFEKEIDRVELEIEDKCIELIALQQPIAKDLRRIIGIIKMISDLERVGDYSENIAEIVIKIGKEKFIKPLVDIPKMAEISKDMIRLSLDSYVKEDTNLAKEVFDMDDSVDHLYEMIYMELLTILSKDASVMDQVIDLLFIGRYLERIADHATNICENVNFIVKGKMTFH